MDVTEQRAINELLSMIVVQSAMEILVISLRRVRDALPNFSASATSKEVASSASMADQLDFLIIFFSLAPGLPGSGTSRQPETYFQQLEVWIRQSMLYYKMLTLMVNAVKAVEDAINDNYESDATTAIDYCDLDLKIACQKDLIETGTSEMLAKLFVKMVTFKPVVDEAMRLKLIEAKGKLSRDDINDFEYTFRMFSTEDEVGIIMRGHIMIEKSLRKCLISYFVDTKYLNLGFKQLVELLYASGALTEAERFFVLKLNRLRNDIAHTPQSLQASAEIDALWALFLKQPEVTSLVFKMKMDIRAQMKLTYMYAFYHLIFSSRSGALERKKLTSSLAKSGSFADSMEQLFQSALVVLYVNMSLAAGAI